MAVFKCTCFSCRAIGSREKMRGRTSLVEAATHRKAIEVFRQYYEFLDTETVLVTRVVAGYLTLQNNEILKRKKEPTP